MRAAFRQLFLLIGLTSLLALPTAAKAQAPAAPGRFVPRVFRDEQGEHRYMVFVPAGYTPQRKWPTILYLHGAGERGTDGQLPTTVGLGPYVRARGANFPFLVVFPQAENLQGRILTGWQAGSPDAERAVKILDQVERDYSVDRGREYLVGWSMGGYGAWSLGAAYPGRWAAVVPASGGGDPSTVAGLKDVPVWAFHGALDHVVLPEQSRQMVEALRSAGGHVYYTELPQAAHDVAAPVFGGDALYEWLLDPRQNAYALYAQRGRPGQRPPLDGADNQPFVPALVAPQTMYVRIGNDVLQSLAEMAPSMVSPDLLRGTANDITESRQVLGHTVYSTLSGLTYQAELAGVRVQAYAPGRLNIQLGIQNLQMLISSTRISTRRRQMAMAGPVWIVVGHRYPVWLSIDVTPYVQGQQLRLALLGTSVQISDDNWYVTNPAWVDEHALLLTDRRVASEIVSGLSKSKSRIQSQIAQAAPRMIQELERQLEVTEASRLISALWPLPVYRPRVRAWPEQVLVDPLGISLVLGVTAAAVDPLHAPRQPRVVPPAGIPVTAVPQTRGLQFGVATGVLSPLSAMLIQEDLARINMLDVPEKSFADFADPKVMAEVIPDLKRFGPDVRISTELNLVQPLRVGDPAKPPEGSGSPKKSQDSAGGTVLAETAPLEFRLPQLRVEVSIKPNPTESRWMPYAQFDLEIAQLAQARILRHADHPRSLRIDWLGDPEMRATARFAPGVQPRDKTLNVDRFVDLFRERWEKWIQSEPVAAVPVPDIDLGRAKFRIGDVGWHSPMLSGRFDPAGIVITNRSQETATYEIKGPGTVWSVPYSLAPGESHWFGVATPLDFHRSLPTGDELYTLPPGSHAEFRVPATGGSPRLHSVDVAPSSP